ncbi:yceG [Wigglesworthia glossinidia endosymbiont of Glossina brevipalpis]|uniref:Endolytic murein transglycosylase n=1 Tax=Wigglesworthia glossinidia brevipalpis TaxID=36870 RepID=Q8D3A8_WIGBR|nr:yceG [Wigglesworthia glossinidia endosymbiont of Glossina brevipalpis]
MSYYLYCIRSKYKMKKKINKILYLLILIPIFFFRLFIFERESLHINNNALITIKKGSTILDLKNLMEEKTFNNHLYLLPWLIKLYPKYKYIKAGTYFLKTEYNIKDALNIFVLGKEKQFSITFFEGSTLQDCLIILKNSPYIEQDLINVNIYNLSEKLGYKYKFPLEGSLYPDTYLYVKNTKASEILKRAKRNMDVILEKIWDNREYDLPYKNSQSLLIMASIIEKETSIKKERAIVASVFVNRLKNKMKLQSDPTVMYGLRNKKTINHNDLTIPTKYNTYIINGLPPTPISMPGFESIYAAAHPKKSNYFYFVSNGYGSHIFSENFNNHKKAIKQYINKKVQFNDKK